MGSALAPLEALGTEGVVAGGRAGPGGVTAALLTFQPGNDPDALVQAGMLIGGEWVEAADGREAVLVSHQLPIWTLRRYVERKRLWHDPRRRQCGLASLTTFHFDGAKIVGIGYSEPAAHLVATSPTARTAKGA